MDKHIFEDGELNRDSVVRKFRTTTQHGAIEGKTPSHEVSYYNLDSSSPWATVFSRK